MKYFWLQLRSVTGIICGSRIVKSAVSVVTIKI